MLEVFGAVLATIQFLGCLTKSVHEAKQAYDGIKEFDEQTREMESMIEITKSHIHNLKRCLKQHSKDSPSGVHTKQAIKLMPTLEVCNDAFVKLTAVCNRIWAKRDFLRRARGYCRLESSRDQIHKLRDVIKSCLHALESSLFLSKL